MSCPNVSDPTLSAPDLVKKLQNSGVLQRIVLMVFMAFFQQLSVVSRVEAQSPIDLENWNPGYMVTQEEDTIFGPVIVNYSTDLIQVNEENTVKTYGANQVSMAYIKENSGGEERYFYSFRYHPFSDFKPFKIFEMIFSGKHLCLLAREVMVTETIPMTDNFTFRTYYTTRTRMANEFYFMFSPDRIKLFSGSKKDLLKLLEDKKEEIKKYLTINKINLGEKEDLLKIALEYNKIKTQ